MAIKKKLKWYTVSKNPSGFLGEGSSYHVEPGKVAGHKKVMAMNPREAIRKAYGKKRTQRIARGYIPRF